MRIAPLPLIASAALLLAPLPVLAASGPEIELHIEAVGDAPPQQARVEFEIEAVADTLEGASKGLEAAGADLAAKFAKIGIKSEQITFKDQRQPEYPVPVAVTTVSVRNDPAPQAKAKPPASPPPPVVIMPPMAAATKGQHRQRQTVTISLDSLDRLEEVRAKSREFSNNDYRTPRVIYVQRDPLAARDEAVAKAIKNARAEADRYAAAMGYRVVRVVRVSNAKPTLNLPDVFTFISTIDRAGPNDRVSASVWAGAAIDFVIAPN